MALGNYKIKVVPVLDTASLHKQLEGAGVSGNLKKAGASAGEAYSKGLFTAIKERAKYSVANALIYGSINAMKDMVANVRELDKAQVELKKVTDLSGKSLEKYTEQAYKMSGAVAKTGTEIIQASTEFAKQGFDPQTALQLSNVASQFQNIADTEIDAATAAKFINSQLKAFGNTDYFSKFNTDAEKATAVIDAVNEVANNFGVGTNDLQMALTKTSAAMKGYGNSYAETIGLITAGTEVMPNQASKVARGWRSIGANILKAAQESDTFEAANGKVNISLRDSEGNLKSTFSILQDLYNGVKDQSVAWNELSEEEKSSISLLLSGKTQTEVFRSTMDNFTSAIRANQTAMDSQGSAARENEKYLDSIQGRIKAFQSAWEQLSYHIVSSDLIKNVVSIGTQIITTIDNIVQKIGALPTALGIVAGAFGALKLTKVVEGFLGLGKAVEGVAEGAEAVGAVSRGAKGLGGLKTVLTALTNPTVLVGLGALAAAIAAIEIDKYFSFESSIKRLDEYSDKLEDVTSQIEELKKKRDSDEGLTSAEKTHLAVLEAEERSLERQIKLEQQRANKAFQKEATQSQGKAFQERTGPKQLLEYNDAQRKRLELDKKITDQLNLIADAEKEAQYYRMTGDTQSEELMEAYITEYTKQLDKLYDKYTKVDAEAAEATSNLAQYWEEISANVDYDSLTDGAKEKFDEVHKAFIESKIDADNLKDSYVDVVTALSGAMDSLGHDNLDLFDNIDISSIKTVEDAIEAVKKQIKSLGDDTEITFKVKTPEGDIQEITKKVSELTDEDYQAIINFNETGIGQVDAEANDAARTRESIVKVAQEGAQAVSGVIDDTAKDRDTTVHVKESGAGSVKSTIDALTKPVTTVVNIVKNITTKQSAKGKRKGEPGGVSWLGDEGTANNPKPELVVSDDGAYLAGTSGWELYDLKDSDTVYSYSETKKLLGGRQTFVGSVDELPRFKKGKKAKKKKVTKATNANVAKAQAKVKNAKNKKTKKKAKKQLESLKKKRQKKRDAFDKELEKLQHKAKVNHWTDAKYQTEYNKLYNKYKAYLSGDQSNDYTEAREEYQNAYAKEVFDRRIGNISMGHGDLEDLVADIKKNVNMSADEKEDAVADAYKASVEYNLKEYKNGKKTRAKVVEDIKNYYKTRGKYDEDYYKMLDELREADKEKELDRLKTLQKTQDDSLSLAQKYLNKELKAVRKQIDADKEEAEQLEKLTELEKELNKAKSTKIRIYKEGVGFVYEQDIEAINEAEKALTDYQKSLEKSPLEEYAEQLETILDLFDELGDESEIKELELALGVSSLTKLTGGNLGTNVSAWTKWISDKYAKSAGYSDLIEQLGNVATSDILKWLTTADNTQVSSNLISQYLNKHSFANGVLSAPGGLSQVGEKLKGELVWLGKGDSVYSNAISKNLMEWGKYSPAQISNINKSGANQIFNFDKIVLPNVHNAETFYKELQNLPNKALQQSTMRI